MEYTYISSRQNPTVQLVSGLSSKKGRMTEGLYVVEGRKLCSETLGRCKIKYALLSEKQLENSELCELCEQCGGEVIVLSESAYMKISADSSPDGIAFVCRMFADDIKITEGDRVFILEAVRDPGNVGTILRSAAAFGYNAVILCDCADVYNHKVLRASMGAAFKLKLWETDTFDGVFEVLRGQGRRIVGATLANNSLVCGSDSLSCRDCIIVGNEGHGISKETVDACDKTIIIPMTDKTESLNAAAAATVLMWQYGMNNSCD